MRKSNQSSALNLIIGVICIEYSCICVNMQLGIDGESQGISHRSGKEVVGSEQPLEPGKLPNLL